MPPVPARHGSRPALGRRAPEIAGHPDHAVVAQLYQVRLQRTAGDAVQHGRHVIVHRREEIRFRCPPRSSHLFQYLALPRLPVGYYPVNDRLGIPHEETVPWNDMGNVFASPDSPTKGTKCQRPSGSVLMLRPTDLPSAKGSALVRRVRPSNFSGNGRMSTLTNPNP